jgi:CubicO group peptidase (beta-lactamase class C family)
MYKLLASRFTLLVFGTILMSCHSVPSISNSDNWINGAPPGVSRAAWHSAAGIAKLACYMHFVSKQPVEPFVRQMLYNKPESYLYYAAPPRGRPYKVTIGTASVTYSNGVVTRSAVYVGDQGCVVVPNDPGQMFTPTRIISHLPEAAKMDWPMGDRNAVRVDSKFAQALDLAFADPADGTAAVVIIHEGHIVAERYTRGSNAQTLFHGWSASKSVQATMMAVLEHQEKIQVYQPANFAEWRNDDRRNIKLVDALRFATGLWCEDYPAEFYDQIGFSPYVQVYTDAVDAFAYVATLPATAPPGRAVTGQYRDCDQIVIGRAIRETLGSNQDEYLNWAQRELFDKIGVRSLRIGTDVRGNMLGAADAFGNARDWARLGLLWLNDGTAPSGERLISDRFLTIVRWPNPGWVMTDGNAWTAGFDVTDSSLSSADTIEMSGWLGQFVVIIPSARLVLAKFGHEMPDTHSSFRLANGGLPAFRLAVRAAVKAAGK